MEESQGARPRILIIDDMVINQMLLSSQLGALNVETDMCSSGEKGLELYRKNTYDLILLDQHMPDMDGYHTFQEFQKIFAEQGREVPVICETADDSAEGVARLKEAGFAEVLVKPIDFGELHDMMVRRLGEIYQPAQPAREASEEQIAEEYEKLPEWVREIQGLDPRYGIRHCGGHASDYMDALSIFAASINEKTKTVQHYLETHNERIQTLRLHSLKSSARLVGALTLAEQAAALEMAGRVGNEKALESGTEKLISFYQELEDQLKAHLGNASAKEGALPPISEGTLRETYSAMLAALQEKDEESIDTLINSLGEYHLESKDAVRLERLKIARRKADWAQMEDILKEV